MAVTKKYIIHFIISLIFLFGSLRLLGLYTRLTNIDFLTFEEVQLFILALLLIIAFYTGLVNIRDTETSVFMNKYTIKSILRNMGIYLLAMIVFQLLLVITYGLFIEEISLTLSYIVENADYISILTPASWYIIYILGLRLYFLLKSRKIV
jgi:hypothetical protein